MRATRPSSPPIRRTESAGTPVRSGLCHETNLGRVALVGLARLPQRGAVTALHEPFEIVDDVRLAVAEDLDALLPEGLGTDARCTSAWRPSHPHSWRSPRNCRFCRYGAAVRIDRLRAHRPHGGTGERPEHVVHVARFADVASAALRTVHPVVQGNVAGVQPVVDHQRSAAGGHQFVHFRQCRGEAPVESDHQERLWIESFVGRHDGLELGPVEASGFSTKTCFPASSARTTCAA